LSSLCEQDLTLVCALTNPGAGSRRRRRFVARIDAPDKTESGVRCRTVRQFGSDAATHPDPREQRTNAGCRIPRLHVAAFRETEGAFGDHLAEQPFPSALSAGQA